MALRSIPDLLVIRPGDANETAAAWQLAISHRNGPVALILTRQNLPVLDLELFPQIPAGLSRGGYILAEAHQDNPPDLIIVATGSEIHLALEARDTLKKEGASVRVVSFPCWQLFQAQPNSYQEEIFPPQIPILVMEAGVSLGWRPYINMLPNLEVIGVDRFGASAPGKMVLQEYGFNLDNVCQRARALMKRQVL